MLTTEEQREIAEEVGRYPNTMAAIPEALKIAQRARGWVSDETLREVAEVLGMLPAELDAIATFYNLIFRRPVGKHVIFVCDSVSCWIMGYEDLLRHLQVKLGITMGETTRDGLFTLLPIACLGACDIAPAMMIDETLYGHLTAEKIDSILAALIHETD